jgi:hypothetical protein
VDRRAVECLEAGIDVRAPLLPAQTTRADAALAPMSALVWLLLQRWFSLRGPAHAEAAVERALERMRAAGLQRMAHWVEQARSASAERGPAAWRSPEAPWQQLLGVLSELASQDSKASRSTRTSASIRGSGSCCRRFWNPAACCASNSSSRNPARAAAGPAGGGS